MDNYKGVLVFIEQRDRVLHQVGIELLGAGRKLANQLNASLYACVLGYQIDGLLPLINQYGPDEIYTMDDLLLDKYINEPYTKALTEVIHHIKPEVVLIGATTIGRDLAPRVSSRLHTGLTADCTELDIDEKQQLLMTRPAFGGHLMATIICPEHRPQMSTVRPGVMVKPPINLNHHAKITKLKSVLESSDMNIALLEEVFEEKEKINIQDAKVLVSVGRGIGSIEQMKVCENLAKRLSGELSGTRPVIENGWLDKSRQVGQTGVTVRPDVYIACGISGAIQHVSGMDDSGLIIAINKNPAAAIFDVADIGIVGDASKVIDAINKGLDK